MGKMSVKPGPGMRALNAFVQGMSQDAAKIGFFKSAVYPDGTPIAYVASIQEFGYPEGGIPPRPFMRNAMDANGREWTRNFGILAKRVVNGRMSPRDALEAIGVLAAGDVRKSISALTTPPLAKSTLQARYRRATSGGSPIKYLSIKPLVDTGALLAHVTHVVEPSEK